MSALFTTSDGTWGSPAPVDLAESIRRMGVTLRESHAIQPGSMLLVSPPDFRSLFALPPAFEAEEPPFGLTDFRIHMRYDLPAFPRAMVMNAVICDGPTRYEFRLGPYTDVSEPWCVVKNLDTDRREVHDWPLPARIAESLRNPPPGAREDGRS